MPTPPETPAPTPPLSLPTDSLAAHPSEAVPQPPAPPSPQAKPIEETPPTPDAETAKQDPEAVASSSAGLRTWTDSTGRFQIEAQLVSDDGSTVTLKKQSGQLVTIPLEKLSSADRAFFRSSVPSVPPAAAMPRPAGDTELVGGEAGFPFRNEGPGPLLGIRCALSRWDNEQAIGPLQAVFHRSGPVAAPGAAIARHGYAVGALNVDANRFVNAIQVVFMRRKSDGRLDPSESYTSEWIGHVTGRPARTLGGSGAQVRGIYGRRGAVLDAVGLILSDE
ncbi:MAG: hypothetical protein HUU20_18870 [Pirellulales bacterium]|nr:hypothetical protein [Pirellulales bacterium]